MINHIKRQLFQSAKVKENLAETQAENILSIGKACAESLKNGGKIMFCGNGGSAADSQHLATELVVRLTSERNRKALGGIALTTDTSILTACSNDYGYDDIFSRQVEALGKPGDILIAISTSGNSPNVLKAAEMAKKNSIKVVGFSGGKDGGKLAKSADMMLIVPSEIGQRIQESHITVGHIVIEIIEQELFGDK